MRSVLPANFEDPVGLARRILASRNRAAYSAAATAAGALLAAPLDALLSRRETSLVRSATAPSLPLIFVTGAPRSGTTLVAETLSAHLDVVGFNNLTQLFPRAPITANLVLGRFLRARPPAYRAYYGRTSGLASHNDGLHIWDRWWPSSRYQTPAGFTPGQADGMRRFFGAFQDAFGKPFLGKNNALCTCVDAVAAVLPTARFLCVQREAAYNAQSILVARETIQGSRTKPYGVGAPAGWNAVGPIEEVCAQVLFHHERAFEQQRALGEDRVWIVEYEDFCLDPGALVERVAREILDREPPADLPMPAFRVSRRRTLPEADFSAIVEAVARFSSRQDA